MGKQTAVEWLIKEFSEILGPLETKPMQDLLMMDAMKRAKQMEEQQHKETFKQSRQAKIFEKDMPPVWESFEQYYNETYGSK